MPRKKDKDWFYHMRSHFAWIWTLTGVFYSEHSFCCFTDYTKLYVCAHRVSKTLPAGLEAGPALVVSQVSRVGSPCPGLACSRQDQLAQPPHPQSHRDLFVLVKPAFIQTPECWLQGWDESKVCSAWSSAAEWPLYPHSPQPAHGQGGESTDSMQEVL